MSEWKYNEIIKPKLEPLPFPHTEIFFMETKYGNHGLLEINKMTYRGKSISELGLTNNELVELEHHV